MTNRFWARWWARRPVRDRARPNVGALAGIALILAGYPALALAKPGKDAAPNRDGLSIELNKLEPHADGCRVFLVFHNGRDIDYEALRLGLVLFGTDGVIAKQLAVDAGALPAKKTSVRLFDIAALPCGGIGQILLNDIPVCEGAPNSDCMNGIKVSSRVPNVPLEK